MSYSNDALAIILLTSHLAANREEFHPFTTNEWNKFAGRLLNSSLKRPGGLLESDFKIIIKELLLNETESQRIEKLLSRGGILALELEELWKKGIGIITRADDLYPKSLKNKLKQLAPSLLYYSGDLNLSKCKGIAVVGSRNIDIDDLEYTKELVIKAVKENLVIYSGGAKGIDSVAEMEALNNGGRVVSFIADSLDSKIRKKEIRSYIEEGKLLVLSAAKPSSAFSVGTAMNRNKYIYALSSGAFVIKSDYNKGGTWAGATENIKNSWVKTFVKANSKEKGNIELIKLGAYPIKDLEQIDITNVLNDTCQKTESLYETYQQTDLSEVIHDKREAEINDDNMVNHKVVKSDLPKETKDIDLYNYIVNPLLEVLEQERDIDELSSLLKVNKKQITDWINRAILDCKIIKLNKPVRYIKSRNTLK